MLYSDELIPEEHYTSAYVAERSIAFFERYARGDYGDKPFFLHCSFPDPHHPVTPPERFKNMYDPEEIEPPLSFRDVKNLYEHPFLGPHLKQPVFRGAMIRESTEEEVKKFTALTYGTITCIDHYIGQILASLDKLGLSKNTMIIYTSDHGDLMGDHGMLLKGPSPFNGVLQVPLIWKVPELTKQGVSDSLVSSIDIPKTILNLLKIKERHQPPNMQGYDMIPILKNPGNEIRDCCLISEDEEIGPKGPLRARVRHLITKEFKLTVYGGIKDYGDLFDRKNDPNEMNNLWHDKKYKRVKMEMLDMLLHELLNAQTNYPKRKAGL